MTGAFTKYIEVVATENKEAETGAEAWSNQWICQHNTPKSLSQIKEKNSIKFC